MPKITTNKHDLNENFLMSERRWVYESVYVLFWGLELYQTMNSTEKIFYQNSVICCPHVLGKKLISNTEIMETSYLELHSKGCCG